MMVAVKDVIASVLEELIKRQAALEAQIPFDGNVHFDTELSRELDGNQALLDSFTEIRRRGKYGTKR